MIARKSFLITSSFFFTRFIGWIGFVVLVKYWSDFGRDALGYIGFTIALLAMFNIIADLGFNRAHIKRISEGKDLGTCIGTFAAIKLILTGLMVLIFLIYYAWVNLYSKNSIDSTTNSLLILFVVYYVLLDLTRIADITFEGTKEIAKRQITHLFECVKTPITIIVVFAGVTNLGAYKPPIDIWPESLEPFQRFIASHAIGSLALTYVIATFATFIVGMYFLSKYHIKKPNWELFKSYFSFALPIAIFSVIGVISTNIDKLMLGYFWGPSEVGYYFGFQQVLTTITILYISVGTVLFPTISEFHSAKNYTKIKKTTHLAERYISMVMVPPVVLIIALVDPYIRIIMSNTFLPAASALMVLAVYIYIFSLNRPYGSLIGGVNRPDVSLKIGIVMCVTNIILNFFFIPKDGLISTFGIYGSTGAATATAISALIGFIGVRIAAKKLIGIKISQRHTPYHILAGVIMGVILHLFVVRSNYFPVVQFYHLVVFTLLGIGIYVGLLYLFREFTKKDFKFFLDIIHPIEIMKYVVSEIRHKPKKK